LVNAPERVEIRRLRVTNSKGHGAIVAASRGRKTGALSSETFSPSFPQLDKLGATEL
jgi:hypothetical protein